jgi:glycine dehydrogenase
MSAPRPSRPVLYDIHRTSGATFTTFAGWEMPLHYGGGATSGAIAEHHAVRNAAGLFDISHMGRLVVTGPGASRWLASLVSSDVTTLDVGRSSYALLCREDGGVIDDVFVYRHDNEAFLVVVNAARKNRDLEWLRGRLSPEDASGRGVAPGCTLEDISDDTAMLALQGPMAAAVLRSSWPADLERFGIEALPGGGWVSRTGYTGEDGFELIVPSEQATGTWSGLLEAADRAGVPCVPAGLAARDSLRLEAGFALYGHELSEEVTPVEARLLWACDLDHDFVGREAILRRRDEGPERTLRRLVVRKGGVPREGFPVLDGEGNRVGAVVSGGKAPSFDLFLANAYVDAGVPRTAGLAVDIRGRRVPAEQHRGPLYRPTYEALRPAPDQLDRGSEFSARHLGVADDAERREMLRTIGVSSVDELVQEVVPDSVRRYPEMNLPAPLTEDAFLRRMRELGAKNRALRSLIGMGYSDTITPAVIQRNILENPKWYTSYTPYQPEISQGRLEALLNFQTMVADLTGMEIANASMLDEATAAAEAVMMAFRRHKQAENEEPSVTLSTGLHPQTIAHIRTRGEAVGLRVDVAAEPAIVPGLVAVVLQYPDTRGRVRDYRRLVEEAHAAGASVVVATDLLALSLLSPPGEWGADVVVGNSQRFGVPMAYGGPHAAFLATRDSWKRQLPGRLVGVSRDSRGRRALRLALQTREQHIRRDKATSNICTAQALLAVMASMYAVYHGPEGLKGIARRVRLLAETFREAVGQLGFSVEQGPIFDTVVFRPPVGDAGSGDGAGTPVPDIPAAARSAGYNLRRFEDGSLGAAFDEVSNLGEIDALIRALAAEIGAEAPDIEAVSRSVSPRPPLPFERRSPFLQEEVFGRYHTETELLRYITSLEEKDISLVHSMIPLGSCTMKLNPTAALLPISWPEFAGLHPYAPADQAEGYRELARDLGGWLCEINEMHGYTLQPNSGAQGEYTGLLIIRAWHRMRAERQPGPSAGSQPERDLCLIPDSAHGTNPASAAMAGFSVAVVPSTAGGEIDLDALGKTLEAEGSRVAAMMVTYPSTYGLFDRNVPKAIEMVHRVGGQVYLDGANVNAQVGLTSPGRIGADVCHLNLHKSFAIPHGGGGPGVGPVLTAEHLTPFLPGTVDNPGPTGVVVGAPLGSAGILPVSYGYIAMLGAPGLRSASEGAILGANYIASRLAPRINIAFAGAGPQPGPLRRVGHECILDFRRVEKETGVTVEDVAKRLMDYGYHAPTMSWPVPGSLMVEPTESESKEELDRFCEAMLSILDEIEEIRRGEVALEESLPRQAPHTAVDLVDEWDRPYDRNRAVFPAPWCRERKFWPGSNRVDNPYGDKNLVCSCAGLEDWKT